MVMCATCLLVDKTTSPDTLACSHCGKPIRDTQHAVNEVGRLHAENERLRAAVETAAAMVNQADPDLSAALLKLLGRDKCR